MSAQRILFFSIILSVGLHILIVLMTREWSHFQPRVEIQPKAIEVSLLNSKPKDVVDTFQHTAKEAPKKADYISSRDLRTDKETSPVNSPTNVATPPKSQTKDIQKKKVESFSLSKKEMVAMNDPLLQKYVPNKNRNFSPGFLKRLKTGEALKVNALGLDYGQYIVRMKERLIQRWDPRRTISPAMYDYDEVVCTLAVVLNNKGELVDLRVLNGSFFKGYDEEAIKAFRESAPFPNPPRSLIQNDGRVYLPWTFHLSFRTWGLSQIN